MIASHLIIRFRGADANAHRLDMRRLGEALIGVDRLVTHGLVALETGKFPRGREARPLAMQASGPTPGSLEMIAWLVPGLPVLPLVYQAYVWAGAELVWPWVTSALMKVAGWDTEATALTRQAIKAKDAADERRHQEALIAEEHRHREAMAAGERLGRHVQVVEEHRHQEVMAASQMAQAAVQLVASVGRSCEDIVLANDNDALVINEELAARIRARGSTGEVRQIRAGVRGLSRDRRHLQLLLPDMQVVPGRVLDPLFEDVPNAYTDALVEQSWLDVTVRPVMRDGQLRSYDVLGASLAEG